ncbi:MAG: VTT domain-containing protein [Pelomonas sp.]|nr:VTT domain-containing protein [Roseateles sp.]
MEILVSVLQFALHVDQHLAGFVAAYGPWIYALLFLVVFVETGVVVMPLLPGDSLLFIVGALCGTGVLDPWVAVPTLVAAAIAGNQSNYTIGRIVGPRVFQWEQSRWFNRRAFDNAHAFYERWGGVTIVLARFMPFVRTFAPFVAGVAAMGRARFTLYDVTGGLLWVVGVTSLGLAFGNVPWVKAHFEYIVWGTILVPGVIAIVGGLRSRGAKPAGKAGA